MTDRIPFDRIRDLIEARDHDDAKRALTTALHGINDSERVIREKTASLRAALDDTETRLANGLGIDGNLIHRAAADLDKAAAARQLHWSAATVLLAPAELAVIRSWPLPSAAPSDGTDGTGTATSPYPALVGHVHQRLVDDGFTVTWEPDQVGYVLELERREGAGREAYRAFGATMQDAWDAVRAQLAEQAEAIRNMGRLS